MAVLALFFFLHDLTEIVIFIDNKLVTPICLSFIKSMIRFHKDIFKILFCIHNTNSHTDSKLLLQLTDIQIAYIIYNT